MAERRFDVMGTRAHVLVESTTTDDDHLLEYAVARLNDLERRWSRFVPTSEISRWNSQRGQPFRPSDVTWRLVRAAADANHRTEGRFVPTLLDPLTDLGYDRPFGPDMATATTDAAEATRRTPRHTPRWTSADEPRPTLTLDPCDGSVRSVNGFDPGGIGKGFAADLIVDELIEIGAERAVANIGGDLRIGHALQGSASMIDPVDVAVSEDLDTGRFETTVRLDHGAVATSTTRRRRWLRDGRAVHHIVDPRTGDAARSPAVVATVIAAEAWWAEAVATSLIVDPSFTPERACGLVVFADGTQRTIGAFGDYCPTHPARPELTGSRS